MVNNLQSYNRQSYRRKIYALVIWLIATSWALYLLFFFDATGFAQIVARFLGGFVVVLAAQAALGQLGWKSTFLGNRDLEEESQILQRDRRTDSLRRLEAFLLTAQWLGGKGEVGERIGSMLATMKQDSSFVPIFPRSTSSKIVRTIVEKIDDYPTSIVHPLARYLAFLDQVEEVRIELRSEKFLSDNISQERRLALVQDYCDMLMKSLSLRDQTLDLVRALRRGEEMKSESDSLEY